MTNFDHIVDAGEFGNYWYAVSLSDLVGNQITSIGQQHPHAGPIVGPAGRRGPGPVGIRRAAGLAAGRRSG